MNRKVCVDIVAQTSRETGLPGPNTYLPTGDFGRGTFEPQVRERDAVHRSAGILPGLSIFQRYAVARIFR